LGRPAECPIAFTDIKDKPQRVTNIPASTSTVKAFIQDHVH